MTNRQLIEQTLDEEKDWKEYFNYPDFSPELWAAKFGHNIGCGDLRKYSFPDKTFQTWVHRLFEILHTPGQTADLRKNLLTDQEQKTIRDEIESGF